MSNVKVAYIMRGLPGSGKSTIATQLAGKNWGLVCSTDSYFVDADGVYRFRPNMLVENHEKNQLKFRLLCEEGYSPVICDNTNMSHWEMRPYVDAAREHGYTVVEVLVGDPRDDSQHATCAARNLHGVPLEVIRKMAKRFQR